jgi:hypothetical protein
MRCQQCGTADVEFKECRQFGEGPQHRLWRYGCPNCSAEYTAVREDWTLIPVVFFDDPVEQVPIDLCGRAVPWAEDLLATNPDLQNRVWYGTEEGCLPVLLAPTTVLMPLPGEDKTTHRHEQAEVCSFCQKSVIPIYHCIGCGQLVCFDCSSKDEHGRVCLECAPGRNEAVEAYVKRRPLL